MPPTPVWSWDARPVSLGQEPMPADGLMQANAVEVPEVVVAGAVTIYAFVIGI